MRVVPTSQAKEWEQRGLGGLAAGAPRQLCLKGALERSPSPVSPPSGDRHGLLADGPGCPCRVGRPRVRQPHGGMALTLLLSCRSPATRE